MAFRWTSASENRLPFRARQRSASRRRWPLCLPVSVSHQTSLLPALEWLVRVFLRVCSLIHHALCLFLLSHWELCVSADLCHVITKFIDCGGVFSSTSEDRGICGPLLFFYFLHLSTDRCQRKKNWLHTRSRNGIQKVCFVLISLFSFAGLFSACSVFRRSTCFREKRNILASFVKISSVKN